MKLVEGGRISERQATLLLVTTLIATSGMFLPPLITSLVGQDSWLAMCIGTAAALAVPVLLGALAARHPGLSLVQIAELVLGKVPGKTLSAFFIFWLIHVNAIVVREMADYVTTNVLEVTPLQVVTGLFAVNVAILAVLGLEVIARSNEVILPITAVMLLTVTALLAKDFHPEHLAPVLEHGWRPILQASAVPAAFQGEILLLGMIMPALERRDRIRRIGLWACLLPLVIILPITVGSIMLFGPEEAGRITSTVEMPRTIQVAEFVERVEALPIAILLAGLFVKIAFFLYVAILATAQVSGLSDYRPLAFSVAAVTSALSIGLFDDVVELLHFIGRLWGPYGLTVEVGFPLLLLLASLARGLGKGGRRGAPVKGGEAG